MKMHMRTSRGFLLLDVMVGGALVALILATLLVILASARAKNVAASRDLVATQLVLEEIDRQRAASFANVPLLPASPVVTTSGTYLRSASQPAAGNESIIGFSLPFKDVMVKVTYESEGKTRTSQATTRIYE